MTVGYDEWCFRVEHVCWRATINAIRLQVRFPRWSSYSYRLYSPINDVSVTYKYFTDRKFFLLFLVSYS